MGKNAYQLMDFDIKKAGIPADELIFLLNSVLLCLKKTPYIGDDF